MLSEDYITSKHVSNIPVTFVTHERFAVVVFLLSCCVNSQLLAHRFSSKRETARSVGRWEKTLYLSVGIPSGKPLQKRREPLPRPDFVWLIALDLSLDDLLYPVGIIDKNAGVEE